MLSHYRLVEKIGEGGMGVVWKAHDDKLRRDVALKVLPSKLVGDPERRRRFLREARTAAAVTHPNIAVVHEVDEADGVTFIAMELLEGKNLRALMAGASLPISDALDIAVGIAQGLVHAHRSRIVHRDLKPENVIVGSDRQVKILDFGLAKIHEEREARQSQLSQAETVTEEMTREGRILGTPAYMSPEQAAGKPVDTRSDIFSFGATLYEMITGKAPFQGKTHVDTLAAILNDPAVPPSRLNARVPSELERVLGKCLEKDPKERYQDTEDLAVDLRKLRGTTGIIAPAFREEPRLTRRWPMALAGVLALAAVVLGYLWWIGPDADPRTLLILPFEVRGQEEGADYVGRAFAEALAVNLARAEDLSVLPVPARRPDAQEDTLALNRTAQELGAGRLLTGALTREGDAIHVSLSLVDATANRVLWGIQQDAKGNELSALASSVSRGVAEKLGTTTPPRYDFYFHLTGGPKMAASPLLAKALGFTRRFDYSSALQATRRLIEAFPDEPDAHVLRCFALQMNAFYSPGSSEKRKEFEQGLAALDRIDPKNPWDEVFRAMMLGVDGDHREAVDQLSQVLAREDLTPAARGGVLGQRGQWRVFQGDVASGLQDFEEALRLDPANDANHAKLSVAYSNDHRLPGESLRRARQAMALDPASIQNQWFVALALSNLGRWVESVDLWASRCRSNQSQQACGDYALALQKGRFEPEARKAAAEALTMEESIRGLRSLARYYALAGDRTGALRLLALYFKQNSPLSPDLTGLYFGADFASLYGDPEFETLVAQEWEELVAYEAEHCDSEATQKTCGFYALALQKTGQDQGARETAVRAATLPESCFGNHYLARYWALAGDRNGAVSFLHRYLDLGCRRDSEIFANPDLASLHADPVFEAIVAEVEKRLGINDPDE